jgi:transposase InsO family protein
MDGSCSSFWYFRSRLRTSNGFHWMTHFGLPNMITSGRGLQFTSNLWAELCDLLNISHRQTPAYHPEAKGAFKRLHRRLKDALHPAPLQLLGPRRSLGSSLDSIPSQGKTLVFPRLREFLAPLLFYLLSFCRQRSFLLIKFQNY